MGLRLLTYTFTRVQVMLAIDDSESMGESGSSALAFEALTLISKALSRYVRGFVCTRLDGAPSFVHTSFLHAHAPEVDTQNTHTRTHTLVRLEVGELGIVSFGDRVTLLHSFAQPFSDQSGASVLQQVRLFLSLRSSLPTMCVRAAFVRESINNILARVCKHAPTHTYTHARLHAHTRAATRALTLTLCSPPITRTVHVQAKGHELWGPSGDVPEHAAGQRQGYRSPSQPAPVHHLGRCVCVCALLVCVEEQAPVCTLRFCAHVSYLRFASPRTAQCTLSHATVQHCTLAGVCPQVESIRQIVRRYHESGVLLVFIVIDNPKVCRFFARVCVCVRAPCSAAFRWCKF